MKIDEENVFQMMRLVLPEHRSAMNRYENEQARRKSKPVLSQHEWEEMSYVISDAIDAQSTVRLTLFGPHEDEIWHGVPVMYAGNLHRLLMESANECRWIAWSRKNKNIRARFTSSITFQY